MKTLDLKECAEFLKIHKETAQELAAAGELPGAKIGRAWVFLEEDLIDYLRTKVKQQMRARQFDVPSSDLVASRHKPDPETIRVNVRKAGKARRVLNMSPELLREIGRA